jgi:hypothetical protein
MVSFEAALGVEADTKRFQSILRAEGEAVYRAAASLGVRSAIQTLAGLN